MDNVNDMIMQHHRLHISNIFKDIKISDEKKNHIRTVKLGTKHFSAKWVPLIGNGSKASDNDNFARNLDHF